MTFLKGGEGRDFTFFFKKTFLAHFSITSLSAIQVLVCYKNLSHFLQTLSGLLTLRYPTYEYVAENIISKLKKLKIRETLILIHFLIKLARSNFACSFLTMFHRTVFRELSKKITFKPVLFVFGPLFV